MSSVSGSCPAGKVFHITLSTAVLRRQGFGCSEAVSRPLGQRAVLARCWV
jgi:hypothetical protein